MTWQIPARAPGPVPHGANRGPVSYRCTWALVSLTTQSSAGMTRWDPGPGP